MSIHHFIELGMAYLLAAMLPGPSITLIIRNALVYSRQSSIKAALGTIVGTVLQSGLVLITLALIDKDSAFFKILKMLCSIYLIYLGGKILSAKKLEKLQLDKGSKNLPLAGNQNYFLEALLIEFLNPLAFTFFISIISLFVDQQGSFIIRLLCWLEVVGLSFIWFLTVSFVASSKKITLYARNFNRWLELLAGCLFIFFGSKMLIF